MGYKRSGLKDKQIYWLSGVGLFAVCAVIGGVLVKEGTAKREEESTAYYVDLGEDESVGINDSKPIEKETTKESKNTEKETSKQNETSKSTEKETDKQAENETTTKAGELNNSSQSEAVGLTGADLSGLTFSDKSTFMWPVSGNVVIDYDMDNLVYFPTLDVYKCSDAVCIQSNLDTPVYAGANGTVLEIGKNNEIGNFVRMKLGGGYEVTYGQLKDIQVSGGLSIKNGDLIGYVNEPTKYYSLEGANLYIKMTKDGKSVDPMDHLNYE